MMTLVVLFIMILQVMLKEEKIVKDNDTSNALIALINDEWEAISKYNSVIAYSFTRG